jgi:pimeloyl-ACP methyl ester carboxylesterase
VTEEVAELIESHRAAGRSFTAAGVTSFVRSEGDGEPIVLMHGLPSSSYLYRKVIPALARRGFRALSFDLPGLGFAGRPTDFEYTFAGLGAFAGAAVDALGLDRFHLVVHDAGGPVGFEMLAAAPERIKTLTLLNTVVAMDDTPFVMEVYARYAAGRGWPALPPRRPCRALISGIGIHDRTTVSDAEIDVYRELVLRGDGGAAYLQIMRQLRSSPADYRGALKPGSIPYPVQIIWGAHDPVLPLRKHGWRAMEAAGLSSVHAVPGRHFLQEDQAPQIAGLVASFVEGYDPEPTS